jgi:hypothetical protein
MYFSFWTLCDTSLFTRSVQFVFILLQHRISSVLYGGPIIPKWVVNLIVISLFLLAAFELVNNFLCLRKKGSDYTENIKRHHMKFSRSDCCILEYAYKLCRRHYNYHIINMGRMVNDERVYKGFHFKSELQHTGTCSASAQLTVYSSATFVSLRFHSRKEILDGSWKKVV